MIHTRSQRHLAPAAILVLAMVAVACAGTAQPTAVPSTPRAPASAATPSTAPSTTPVPSSTATIAPSSTAPGPSTSPSTSSAVVGILPEGLYRTADTPTEEIVAALRNHGLEPSADGVWYEGDPEWPERFETIAFALRFEGGKMTMIESDDAGPDQIAWEGQYTFIDEHTLLAQETQYPCTQTYDVQMGPDGFHFQLLETSCADTTVPSVAYVESAPFVRE